MKKNAFFVVVFFLCWPTAVLASPEIAIIQSSVIRPYEEAIAGFERYWSGTLPVRGQKAIAPVTLTRYVLQDAKSNQALQKELANSKPDLLLAVGKNALEWVKDFRDIPVVYMMVPHPDNIVRGQEHITGVRMQIEPEKQLDALIRTIPDVKRVGLIYDPKHTADFVKKAQAYAATHGITLVARQAQHENQIPTLLADLDGRIDAFWMLPDKTVITPQTLVHIFLYSFANRVPILSFSDKYLEMGATVSVSLDIPAMGKQAAMMAKEIIDEQQLQKAKGTAAKEFNVAVNTQRPAPAAAASDTKLAGGFIKIDVNSMMARKLGIDVHLDIANEKPTR